MPYDWIPHDYSRHRLYTHYRHYCYACRTVSVSAFIAVYFTWRYAVTSDTTSAYSRNVALSALTPQLVVFMDSWRTTRRAHDYKLFPVARLGFLLLVSTMTLWPLHGVGSIDWPLGSPLPVCLPTEAA